MNIKNLDKHIVSEDRIKNDPNAIVYDPFGDASPNLPDVGNVLDKVMEILEYMLDDSIKKMKSSNINEYNSHMENKFSEFSNRYYGLFQKIISGEDITPLLSMLASIDKVKSGSATLETVEEQLGEELANKYIYPNLTNDQKKKIKNTIKDQLKK